MRDRLFHDPSWPDAPEPEATETENPIVKKLLGPKGEVIRQWSERPTVKFGFQPKEGHR